MTIWPGLQIGDHECHESTNLTPPKYVYKGIGGKFLTSFRDVCNSFSSRPPDPKSV